MSENPIDRLESQLESLIEGAFARLLRRTISAHDIAILLLRAMQNNAALALPPNSTLVAPDIYRICLHPDNAAQFLARFPDLAARLSRLIIDLSRDSGYELFTEPHVSVLADDRLALHRARITAEHSPASCARTEKMPAVQRSESPADLSQAFIHIEGSRVVPLEKSIISIGRENDNDIVIEDAYISRHHLQLRKQYGAYTLFDTNSRGGTNVNNAMVREHRLRNGDVIYIGHTCLVYTDGNGLGITDDTTQVLASD